MRLAAVSLATLLAACGPSTPEPVTQPDTSTETQPEPDTEAAAEDTFEWQAERFADVQILRYQVPGFDELSLQQKQLLYYLSEAALAGRDIIFDQKYRHNLTIRRTLEAVETSYSGERSGADWDGFQAYLMQVWYARGIHHDYSTRKFEPTFSKEAFATFVKGADAAKLPLAEGQTPEQLIEMLTPVIFDPKVDAKRVNKASGADLIADSANNFYGPDVKQKDVEKYYRKKIDKKDPRPVSWGLNSQLVKGKRGKLEERVWKVGGMYDPAIKEIVGWLKKAVAVAENEKQKDALSKLVTYYETGELAAFDAYNIAWVADTDSRIDVVNGFIEVYGDAMGYRGSWESVVSFKDMEATKRIAAIAGQAQWFEDNSPLLENHKKKDVVGISAKVITVVQEAGDSSPSTPIGINLPNSDWIRKEHGSKSVNLGNIVHAYDSSRSGDGTLQEWASSEEEVERAKKYGPLGHTLLVDMHEVIGHASGQLEDGIGTPKQTLKNYASALEEGRADLVGLYYVMDPKLVELGLMPSLDVGKAEYDSYIRNGLMAQLSRLPLGEEIEEAHMRNRQMVAGWAYAQGKKDNVIERIEKDGKTYFVINDYDKLRELFGQLLQEIQRIKSQGDFKAGKALIETYGVKVDRKLHEEVLKRYAALDVKPYKGFIQPKLVPVMEGDEIVDVKIEYPTSFKTQMLEYSEKYSFLPHEN